jgi:hypothetical protein
MDWEHRLCLERGCSETWYVAADGRGYKVWYVAREPGSCPTVVAASEPICPRCGAALLTIVELEGGFGELDALEVGSIFDYARSL